MRRLVAAALWALTVASVAAQMAPDAQRSVDAYRSALSVAGAGRAGSIERAFDALMPLRDSLLQGNLLESLNEDAFALLVRQLRGVIVNRRGVQYVQPDITYFSELAGSRGDAADKAFFAALKSTYPDSVWPAYVQRQTDFGGCTRFGSLALVDGYRAWSQFHQRYPTRYGVAVNDELEAILELVTDGSCACGSQTQVERELTEFNARFPASPARLEIADRLRDLDSGRSGIRFSCVAG